MNFPLHNLHNLREEVGLPPPIQVVVAQTHPHVLILQDPPVPVKKLLKTQRPSTLMMEITFLMCILTGKNRWLLNLKYRGIRR